VALSTEFGIGYWIHWTRFESTSNNGATANLYNSTQHTVSLSCLLCLHQPVLGNDF
jgi:hypothetical protein